MPTMLFGLNNRKFNRFFKLISFSSFQLSLSIDSDALVISTWQYSGLGYVMPESATGYVL